MQDYDFDSMILRIKQIKKKQGLTNSELSEKSGVSLGALNKVLGTETKEPLLPTIIKLSKALEVSTNYLIFGAEPTADILDFPQQKILFLFDQLNAGGQERVIEYTEDLVVGGRYKT